MPSERIQKRIDRLLDQADEAADARDWITVLESVRGVLSVDPQNDDALSLQTIASAAMGEEAKSAAPPPPSPVEPSDSPSSFANGRYEVTGFLGEGGKKKVYLCHDTTLDRDVAFGLIKADGLDDASRQRITREAQAMARLGDNPNIMPIFDLGEENGQPYMVGPLMGGGDVEALIEDAEDGRLALEDALRISSEICRGLEFAHSKSIIHRDLKPGNVWLTDDGTARIGDFGLAISLDRSRLTQEKMMVGTVSYMPPEQATGGEVTPRSDLYSLGAMLYEMVTGRPPFMGDDEIAIIGQHINTPPVAPTWHNRDCPRPLEALIMRLLAKDPSERPESARDVLNALDAIDLTTQGEQAEQDPTSLDSMAGGVFVGRQAEMGQLKAGLEDVLGGRGRLITLVGEPGIGKTRISEELATYAGMRGAQVLWGRCYEGGGAPPYWPWVQAIRSYVRDIDADELRRQLGSSASVVAEIVTDVKDRLPDVQPPPQLDDPDSARFRLFDSITSFLKTASQSQPIVIVLDDLHWSDQPSLTFLEFIAREIGQSRVMLVGTYRDMELNRRHPLSVTLGDLARDRLYERVLLRGLSEPDIARFIEIAAGLIPPAELSATVHRHTEGNPLFVTEVVRDLVQSGELTADKTKGRSTWSVRIPEGVREVIGRRLDRLSERANELLTVAAVIGREFTHDALRELAEDTTDGQLLDVLDEALNAKLIEEMPDEIGHYQFTHALFQETLTGELSSARKVRLHARIAETLERLYGEESDEHAAELVPHFVEAELILGSERSINYSIIAGEQALTMSAPQLALGHFEQAFSSLDGGELNAQKARLLYGLGRAEESVTALATNLQVAFDHLSEAFEYYASTDDKEKMESIAFEPLMKRTLVGNDALLETAVSRIDPGTVASGRLHALLAWRAASRRDIERANAELDQAFAINREIGDPAVEYDSLLSRFLIHLLGNSDSDLNEALDDLDLALNVIRSNPNPLNEGEARGWSAIVNLRLGRLPEALSQAETGYEVSSKIGFRTTIQQSCGTALQVCIATGNWEDAREWIERDEVGRDWIGLSPPGGWRIVLRSLLQPIEDIEALRHLTQSADPRLPLVVVGALLITAEVCRAHPGLEFDEELRTSHDRLAGVYEYYHDHALFGTASRVSQAMVAVALKDQDTARDCVRLLSPIGSRLEFTLSVDRVKGLLSTLLDDPDAAASHFENSLSFCRKNGLKKELAWTCSDYAEMLFAGSGQRREKVTALQDEAIAIAQELGMKPLLERVLSQREILKA